MNKKLISALLLIVILLAFTGCSPAEAPVAEETAAAETTTEEPTAEEPSSMYTDGTYQVIYSHTDSHDWIPKLDLVIKDGMIDSAQMDYFKPTGELKSENEGYAAAMSGKSGITPAEAYAEMNARLVATQDIAAVDVVTGATHSFDGFLAMIDVALNAAMEGNTALIVLPMNTTYSASEEAYDERGWKAEIAITFENDVITSVVYNEANEEGLTKRDDEAYNENFFASKGVNHKDSVMALEAQLLDVQDINAVDVVTGATSSSTKFMELAKQALAVRLPATMEMAYTDGTYQVIYSHTDSHDWIPKLDLVIKDGMIESAKMDYFKPTGELKSEDEGYAAAMSGKSGITPAEAYVEMDARLVAAQDIDAVDVVTGATHSFEGFVEMVDVALAAAMAGNTDLVVLPMNTTYSASEEAYDERGWKAEIAITFENDVITSVVYNEANEEGTTKRDDEAYNAAFFESKGVTNKDSVMALEAQFLAVQDIDAVDVVTGATSSSTKFIELANQALAGRKAYQ